MGTRDKLIQRFASQPTDFTWSELVRLFSLFGYEISTKGKTSGSRVLFVRGESSFSMAQASPRQHH